MSAPGGGEGQQRIAVTGASGFIGSRLVPWLEAAGRDVVPVSRQAVQSGRSRVVDRYTDVGALARAFDGCDGVVHLAARAHVLREPDADAQSRFDEANVAGARAVAQACRDAGVGRLVLVSSIGVNGSATCGRPFTASDPPAPDVPYARSKWLGEQAVCEVLRQGPTDYVVLRPPLVYGAGCPGNFRTLMGLVRRAPWIPLGSLRGARSLIHVDNLCAAIDTALQHPEASRRTFVLCDGEDLSVAELARLLARGAGKPESRVVAVPPALLRAAAGLLGRGSTLDKLAAELTVDDSEFRRVTGWRPVRSAREAVAATMRSEVEAR